MKPHILLLACLLLSTTAKAQNDKPSQVTVTTQTIEEMVFYPLKSAPAKVVALNHAKVPARIGGLIEQLNFKVGDSVSKGSVLATLDCQDNQLALEQIEAELRQAQTQLAFNQRELTRAKSLSKKQSITESELDAKATSKTTSDIQTRALNIRLKQQKLQVERCAIKAPFDGLVSARLTSVGEQVAPGQAVMEILQSSEQEVSAQVALSDRHGFNQGKDFFLEVNGEKYALEVRKRLPLVGNNSRSVEARLTFQSTPAYVGVTGRVKWHSPDPHLPAYLLQKRQGNYGFFILEQNKARFIELPNAKEGRPFRLPQSVTQPVIIDGRYSLEDQVQVKRHQSSSE